MNLTRFTENRKLHVVGIGGTLRDHSTSLWALERALRAVELAGATTELLDLSTLNLPAYEPGKPLEDYETEVTRFVNTARRADAMLWSTTAYHGTLAGITKNALDFLEFLSGEEKPYLQDKVVGLIATAGGDLAAVNAANAMVHVVHPAACGDSSGLARDQPRGRFYRQEMGHPA